MGDSAPRKRGEAAAPDGPESTKRVVEHGIASGDSISKVFFFRFFFLLLLLLLLSRYK